jgi:hypothetical protein
MRRKFVIENDQDLSPQGIESFALDRIDHGNEIPLLVQIVRSKDLIDARVVVDIRVRGRVRQLLHIDGEQLAIVESRDLTGSAIRLSLPPRAGAGR